MTSHRELFDPTNLKLAIHMRSLTETLHLHQEDERHYPDHPDEAKSAVKMADTSVSEPFPISLIANRYLLYDINTITYIRRKHCICGVLIGGLPQAPSQNVFCGIPLELMPEEARLLVEEGHAYIVEDVEAHMAGFLDMSEEERNAFMSAVESQGRDAAKAKKRRAGDNKERALKEKNLHRLVQESQTRQASASPDATNTADTDESLFAYPSPPASPPPPRASSTAPGEIFGITPSTSYPPLTMSVRSTNQPLPAVPRSYPLFRHLHSKGYFVTPGLRFGCQYVAYPGDPLRFHSHFLTVGMDWDEKFDLRDVVGGGRLGTGVKKAYLIGGKEENSEKADEDDDIRAFSVEWAYM
ncbi:tRNA-splicing endonuclease subunit Sen34 [Coniosporium apollinis]|uniref:tRNA-splicing endonuclease subunit Sen34 n=2 Tax=Coniosporium TaxID=2810619 RepID=A0ABQ9P485_9PEZI|nr:tRNA-splicing endonuclease subunit Sen34 [Cladosporium sp. JES 115]KAJ9669422.1 tRNA-splicing endonuclease subunit Sen34 [Coniosporium apollinis]